MNVLVERRADNGLDNKIEAKQRDIKRLGGVSEGATDYEADVSIDLSGSTYVMVRRIAECAKKLLQRCIC